ncbi:plasma membrane proteolipid 3 [Gossypium arboreum]|uniref:Plasma membrane proteolipid 3 n=1 Tax=Gossypium arboreum TaxID=29729 RepID=A0A0B0N039_GOSAR|nr:plasma membrane proteolipid 3 [Gossypium arboreum]
MCICVKCGCFSCKHETPAKADDENQETGFLDVMLAIFLPPVAIYKKEKGCTAKFWVNILLSSVAVVPGSIHAAIVISS